VLFFTEHVLTILIFLDELILTVLVLIFLTELVLFTAAKSSATWFSNSVRGVRERNLALDHIMWIRNAPKLFQAEIFSAVRTGVLSCEQQLLNSGHLDEAGDVFHLKMAEVDQALSDPSVDLRAIIAPRKAQYLRAKQARVCPFLVDSRCRILKANVKAQNPGTLLGAAISPGVAVGIVRVLSSPREKIQKGDILATVVTDPSWTPLFVGCAAVILQVGGALQHGALCAREYGKPGVSSIDMGDLKSGMKVSVDGNTGVVTILD
jgi:pyruvate,water dikinase